MLMLSGRFFGLSPLPLPIHAAASSCCARRDSAVFYRRYSPWHLLVLHYNVVRRAVHQAGYLDIRPASPKKKVDSPHTRRQQQPCSVVHPPRPPPPPPEQQLLGGAQRGRPCFDRRAARDSVPKHRGTTRQQGRVSKQTLLRQ